MHNHQLLDVYCTDRGQHSRTPLGDLALIGDTIEVNAAPIYRLTIAERRRSECVWVDDYDKVHLRCPRCRREVQWSHDRARKAIAGLWKDNHDGGVARLDLSTTQ